MTDDTARALFEADVVKSVAGLSLRKLASGLYEDAGMEVRWKYWLKGFLAAWNARATAPDERADAERFRWLLKCRAEHSHAGGVIISTDQDEFRGRSDAEIRVLIDACREGRADG
jgi:hypothetical protein